MERFLMIAEDFRGNEICETWFEAESTKDARSKMWDSLTQRQRDRVASIECVDTISLTEAV